MCTILAVSVIWFHFCIYEWWWLLSAKGIFAANSFINSSFISSSHSNKVLQRVHRLCANDDYEAKYVCDSLHQDSQCETCSTDGCKLNNFLNSFFNLIEVIIYHCLFINVFFRQRSCTIGSNYIDNSRSRGNRKIIFRICAIK